MSRKYSLPRHLAVVVLCIIRHFLYRKETYEKEKKSVSKTDCNNYCNRELKKKYEWLKEVDKFANFSACRRSTNGLYYITHGANAYISAKVEQTLDLGSHTMFIAIIEDMEILNDDASATYAFYQSNIKPSFSNPTTNKKTVWRCTICGYTYEDEELPEDYICPLCKHPASDLKK